MPDITMREGNILNDLKDAEEWATIVFKRN